MARLGEIAEGVVLYGTGLVQLAVLGVVFYHHPELIISTNASLNLAAVGFVGISELLDVWSTNLVTQRKPGEGVEELHNLMGLPAEPTYKDFCTLDNSVRIGVVLVASGLSPLCSIPIGTSKLVAAANNVRLALKK